MTSKTISLADHLLPQHFPFDDERLRAVVLVDGEHYPQVSRDVIDALRDAGWHIEGAILVGGGEKLRETPDYGVPCVTGDSPLDAVIKGCNAFSPRTVIDIGDEPVLVLEERMRIISELNLRGVDWRGADSLVCAPHQVRSVTPSISIVGTGKRIGKTAISGFIARASAEHFDEQVVVVAMGRGGPAEPILMEAISETEALDRLLEISRGGMHAASDYLEDAVLTGCTTVGCRRAGGGLLGAPVDSNVPAGVALVDSMDPAPKLVIYEGSGSCIPPVITHRRIVIGAAERPQDLFDDFSRVRFRGADLAMIVGNDPGRTIQLAERLSLKYPGLNAIAVRLEPTPTRSIEGRRVALFTSAPESIASTMMNRVSDLGGELVVLSHALAKRDQLRIDLASAIERKADCVVVEIKAAGIDTVAEFADENGLETIFLDNPPVPHDSTCDLEKEIIQVVRLAADN